MYIDYRELGLTKIKERLIQDKDALGLKSIKRNSNDPISKDMMNAVFILEGRDYITEHASRSFIGYPAKRMLEVDIEIVTKNDRDGKAIKELYQKVRRTVLCDRTVNPDLSITYNPNPILADNTAIRELRTLGAGLYDIPELIGMKLVLGLYYIDYGFNL